MEHDGAIPGCDVVERQVKSCHDDGKHMTSGWIGRAAWERSWPTNIYVSHAKLRHSARNCFPISTNDWFIDNSACQSLFPEYGEWKNNTTEMQCDGCNSSQIPSINACFPAVPLAATRVGWRRRTAVRLRPQRQRQQPLPPLPPQQLPRRTAWARSRRRVSDEFPKIKGVNSCHFTFDMRQLLNNISSAGDLIQRKGLIRKKGRRIFLKTNLKWNFFLQFLSRSSRRHLHSASLSGAHEHHSTHSALP